MPMRTTAGHPGIFLSRCLMHEDTLEIIRRNNRAYGSRSEDSVLEAFYTRMINLFSRFRTPSGIRCFPRPAGITRGIFPVIGTVHIGDLELEVLEGFGGHTCGQIFLYSRTDGLLFAADSIINFGSLTKERADYSSLAAFLVTSVNVDSELAKKERTALLGLAMETDERTYEIRQALPHLRRPWGRLGPGGREAGRTREDRAVRGRKRRIKGDRQHSKNGMRYLLLFPVKFF